MSARVLVFVSGGNVQGVVTDNPEIKVTVIDYDNKGEPAAEQDADGDECSIDRDMQNLDAATVEKFLGKGETFPLKVRFGKEIPEDERPVEEREFATEEARTAYLDGIADYDGYLDYEVLEDGEEDEEDDEASK